MNTNFFHATAFPWVARGLGLLTIGLILFSSLPGAGAQSGGPTEPVPVYEPPSAFKTAYVNVTLTDQDLVTVNSGGIAFSRPPVNVANPPLIAVILRDKNGVELERYNAWDPRILYVEGDTPNSEGAQILPSAPGNFPYAFRPAIRTMDLFDIPKNKLLASIDVVAAAIRPFCEANPNDVDCRTDLGVSKSDAPDPVAAGTDLVYTIPVTNLGTNPAYATRVVDTLPAGVTYKTATVSSGTVSCTEAPLRTLTCELGVVDPGEPRTLTIMVRVDPDLVFKAGAPTNITNTAVVSNPAGTDAAPGNNNATASTRVIAVADLAVDSLAGVTVPPQLILGQSTTLTIRTVVSNGGPSTPMDATVTRTATAPAGATVSAPASPVAVPALAVGTPQTLNETYTLRCTLPGIQRFTFTAAIAPARPDDTDPNAGNNSREVRVDLDCVVPVAVNIQPGDTPNSINLGNQGGIPLAVLTTTVGEYGLPLAFDATKILPLTVRFGPSGLVATGTGGASEIHNQGHPEDSRELGGRETERDRDTDMVLHFGTQASGLRVTDTEGCVKGDFISSDGNTYRFYGCDAIRIVP